MSTVPTITLDNGVEIPQLGLGVWQVEDSIVTDVVGVGLRGRLPAHRHRRDLRQRERRRPGDRGRRASPATNCSSPPSCGTASRATTRTLKAFDASLERLGLDYVDLYLIHWQSLQQDLYVDTWKAFEQLYADKRVRAIGVSNFHEPALQRIFEETDIRPAVNQIELHPALPQDELRAFNAENDIVTQAWSPLASGELLANPALATIGAKYGKTPAQVMIRWHLQLGNVVIPKS